MLCAVDIYRREAELGDYFCPKHRRCFERARKGQ